MSFKIFHTTYICSYSSNFVHAPQAIIASYFTLKLQTHQLSNFKEMESLQLLKNGPLLCATQTW
jgi:hypothetical protein